MTTKTFTLTIEHDLSNDQEEAIIVFLSRYGKKLGLKKAEFVENK